MNNTDSVQNGQMPRLTRVFAMRKYNFAGVEAMSILLPVKVMAFQTPELLV